MDILVNKKSFLLGPIVLFGGIAVLLAVWAAMEPAALHEAFDQSGHSFVEVFTLPFYALIVPTVWLCCPFGGSRVRQALLASAVSCVAIMAFCKELDLHLAALSALFPDVVANFRGTPFKMRFLTSGQVPFLPKVCASVYFVLFFGVFAALLAYFFRRLVVGFFRLHPVSWTMCCFGMAGVMVQLCDRMPAWIRHVRGLPKSHVIDATSSLFTALEEGGELLIAALALLAIVQAHAIYAQDKPDPKLADL